MKCGMEFNRAQWDSQTDMENVIMFTEVVIEKRGTFLDIMNCARITIGKEPLPKDFEVSNSAKYRMLYSEHSPIREMEFVVLIRNIPYWVSQHYVRHHVGIQPYVLSSRDDRTDDGIERRFKSQSAPVDLRLTMNVQAFINMAKVRLCYKASKETRLVMRLIYNKISDIEPAVAFMAVPQCVYRGFCPEHEVCTEDYCNTTTWDVRRGAYVHKAREVKRSGKSNKAKR